MKGKIKILSLLCAMSMTLAVFSGCSKKGNESSTTNGESIDTSKEVTLVWYHWGDEPKKSDNVIKTLNDQSKKDINTKIDFKWATGNDEKLKSVMASGGVYDIAFTCTWFANYITSAQKGYLADITDMLKKTPKLYESMPESVWNGARVNGKIYGVPTYKDTAATQYWTANKGYIEKAGAMAEFKATSEAVSSVTPLLAKIKAYGSKHGYENGCTAPFMLNKSGLNGLNTGWDTILDNICIGARIGSTKVESYYNNSKYIADLKTLKEWYDKGYINKDCLTLEKEPEYITVSTAQGWEGAEITAWGKGAGKPYDCIINKKAGPYLTNGYILGSCNAIGVNSKNKERALLYLQYANTNEAYRNMLAYGIKDVNYKDNGNGTISYINDDWKPGLFAQAAFTLLKPVSPAPADMYKKIDQANRAATASDLLGFTFNTEKVESKIAAVDAIHQKYYNQLRCGVTTDVDTTVKKMLNEMNAAGYSDIVKEAQSQVDTFIKNK